NLAKDWGLKVLIVGRAGLGTINHTFLTWYYAKSTGLEVIGIILNGFTGKDVSERTNPQIIEEMTGIKPYRVPKIEGIDLPEEVRKGLTDYVLSRLIP
ncbi:MAG: ATP-dependent dethiobiotin synthetase BioD, partial [Aquifex sp.]